MKFGYRPKNTLFYERFRKNWRLKPGPRTGGITFLPSRLVRVTERDERSDDQRSW